MGTSLSQSSPKTTSWRTVTTCYESDQISTDRTASEIWHAATGEAGTIPTQIASPAVFACYQIAQQNVSPEWVHAALSRVSAEYGNSMVVEYAKRATLISAQGAKPAEQWPKVFFRELTNYLVARDASGFVGPTARSKTVPDLISLKNEIGNRVQKRLGNLRMARSAEEWQSVANAAVAALRGVS